MQEKQWIPHDAYKHFGEMRKTNRATRMHLDAFNLKFVLNVLSLLQDCK